MQQKLVTQRTINRKPQTKTTKQNKKKNKNNKTNRRTKTTTDNGIQKNKTETREQKQNS